MFSGWSGDCNGYGVCVITMDGDKSLFASFVPDTTAPVTTAAPVGGTYSSAQTVTLSANETATIYYTLNGATPTTSSPVYTAPLTVSGTTTLKYFAKDSAGNLEAVKSQTYTISAGGSNYGESFDAISTIPAGWTSQTASISSTYHSPAKSLQLGDLVTEGNVSFVAPVTGSLSFWFTKSSEWGYYWAPDDWLQFGTDAGAMTLMVNGTTVYTRTMDTAGAWVKTADFGVHAGDTIKIMQTGSSDDYGALCASTTCHEGDDPYNNVSVHIDDISIIAGNGDTTAPITTASPVGGTYAATQTVILSANKTATIYYTTNGTTPTTGSAIYAAPLSIAATTTLKYFAKDTAGNSEAVKTQTYTIDTSAPITTATPAGGVYASARAVTLAASETATIYYTLDDTIPTLGSPVYTGPLTISSSSTLRYFAKDAAGNKEAVKSQGYTIDSIAPVTTATPTGGTYAAAQTVSLAANETATIYYTLNGTTPTTSSAVYTAPLSIAATTTLKYFAKDTAGNLEAVKTQAYTISTGGSSSYSENFDALSTPPAGWSAQNSSISTMYYSAAKSLTLGDGYSTDGSVSFAAPVTGNLTFWYYKTSVWGYYWLVDDYLEYGTDVGSLKLSVNGVTVLTTTADTNAWVKPAAISVQAGDTIRIEVVGNRDDGGAYCAQLGRECNEGEDPFYSISVNIDDVSIVGNP